MKRLLELAVTNVHFTCNENWYCQKDGLAMSLSLAVILASVWMKFWMPHLKLQTTQCKTNTQFSICRNCEHRVTAHFRGVECEICKRWFRAKCQQISNTEHDRMENQFCMCSFCRENDKTDINQSSKTKFLLRFVNDIVRTVRGDTKELLDADNNLHPNLHFTLETTKDKNILPFPDMSNNVKPMGTIFCTWHQKSSDTGTILK